MKLSITFAFLLINGVCFAQKFNTYFLKNNGRYVKNRDSADYIRIVSEPDSGSVLYNVFEVYADGKKKLLGKSSTINPPKYEGQCATFYENGNRQSVSNYKSGNLANVSYEFYPNGRPYFILTYPDNGELYNAFTNNYLITANYDSQGMALVTDGNGIFKRYDSKLKQVIEWGNVKNGRMDGACTGTTSNGKWHFIEKYDNGILITGTLTDENGTTSFYTKSRGTEPKYKGGLQAFYEYLGRKTIYPKDDREKNVQGKVIMSFVVEKNGKISDIKILRSVSNDIDQEATRVVGNSPNWVPGTQFGRPVRVVYTIPINFALKGD